MSDQTPNQIPGMKPKPWPPSHLDVRLSVTRPIGQDAWDFKLLVNLVTYDAGTVMDDVPQEHRSFLSQWLMDHTTLLDQRGQIDGLAMVSCDDPHDYADAFVAHMAYGLGNHLAEAMHECTKGCLSETPLKRIFKEKDT